MTESGMVRAKRTGREEYSWKQRRVCREVWGSACEEYGRKEATSGSTRQGTQTGLTRPEYGTCG